MAAFPRANYHQVHNLINQGTRFELVMGKNSPPREQVYAVIRVDGPVEGPHHKINITVKEIVRSIEIASSEVARLNVLNADKGCWYFWTTTRLFADGESFGTHFDDHSPRAPSGDP